MSTIEKLLSWLNAGMLPSIIVLIFSIISLTLLILYTIAFFQGKDISFWPPSIKGNSNNKKVLDKSYILINRTYSVTENMLHLYIIDRLKKESNINFNLLDLKKLYPEEGRPINHDAPYISSFIVNKECARISSDIYILFKVQDDGFNFPSEATRLEDYIEIFDSTNMTIFSPQYIATGYLLVNIKFFKDSTIGYHKIVFKLKDMLNHESTQSIKIEVR